ncbi:abc transporter b family member 18 [Fagus crenata]
MGSKPVLFSYTNGVDKLLLLLGTLGSIGDGLMTPLTMLVLSGLINDYSEGGFSIPNDIVDKALEVRACKSGCHVAVQPKLARGKSIRLGLGNQGLTWAGETEIGQFDVNGDRSY